jgi:hypothetical protein
MPLLLLVLAALGDPQVSETKQVERNMRLWILLINQQHDPVIAFVFGPVQFHIHFNTGFTEWRMDVVAAAVAQKETWKWGITGEREGEAPCTKR